MSDYPMIPPFAAWLLHTALDTLLADDRAAQRYVASHNPLDLSDADRALLPDGPWFEHGNLLVQVRQREGIHHPYAYHVRIVARRLRRLVVYRAYGKTIPQAASATRQAMRGMGWQPLRRASPVRYDPICYPDPTDTEECPYYDEDPRSSWWYRQQERHARDDAFYRDYDY